MTERRVLVLGANGQDGSYLVERELEKGRVVLGLGRQPTSRWTPQSPRFEYRSLDLADGILLKAVLREFNPDVVYHFAAIHGPAGFDYDAVSCQVYDINVRSVQVILEHLRVHIHCRMIYASSSKVFSFKDSLIDSTTTRISTCMYTLSKNMSEELISLYRLRFGVHASVVWLFNHESVRRPTGYFIHKVAELVADAVRGCSRNIKFGSLDFWCDWGSAREYMEIVSDVAELNDALDTDYVLGSGSTINAADLVLEVFEAYRLDPCESIDDFSQPTRAVAPWAVDLNGLRQLIQRVPVVPALEVFKELINQKLGK